MTTLVPYAIPGDSATMQALFECDSMNNVLLRTFEESKGKGVESFLQFEKGKLSYKINYKPDTLYLSADTVYKEIPVQVEVEKIEYRQTDWQIIRCRIGDIALMLILLWGLWKIIKIKLKL